MLQQVKIKNGQKVLIPLSGSAPTDSVTSGNMNPVTSNAVYQSFKGMTVTECGYCNPESDYKGWYIKYDNGLIEEYFVRSTTFSSMTASGSLYVVERTAPIPIPLKSGTTPQLVSGSIQSVYSSGKKSAWIASTNEGSDTNSIIYYQIISPLSNGASNMIIRFHVVGFWK